MFIKGRDCTYLVTRPLMPAIWRGNEGVNWWPGAVRGDGLGQMLLCVCRYCLFLSRYFSSPLSLCRCLLSCFPPFCVHGFDCFSVSVCLCLCRCLFLFLCFCLCLVSVCVSGMCLCFSLSLYLAQRQRYLSVLLSTRRKVSHHFGATINFFSVGRFITAIQVVEYFLGLDS